MAVADYSDIDYFEEASFSIEEVQQLASHQVQLNLFYTTTIAPCTEIRARKANGAVLEEELLRCCTWLGSTRSSGVAAKI